MRTKLAILVICLLSIPAIRPLFNSGFFTMHDDQQIVRLAELDLALKGGEIPVRWVQNLGFGYGYPLFIFYPPLVYYLGETYYLLFGLSYIQAMKLVFATSFLAAGFTMYLWTKDKFGFLAGIVAALFYTYAPYRAVDAYVRGALAEAFSFVWLPLILLSIDKLTPSKEFMKTKKINLIWIPVLAVSYAALMLTHNLIVLPFTIIMALYVLFKLFSLDQKQRLTFIGYLILAGFFGLALSMFFWFPALMEKQFTLVDQILLEERYSHEQHYVYPEQLWNSIWGYGGSTEGKLDGFSLKIGKLHLIASAFSVVLGLLLLFTKKEKLTRLHNLFASVLLLIFSIWMTTAYSSIIWDNFSPIQFLQFPWRFLTFTTLFTSALAGASIWLVKRLFSNPILTIGYAFGLIILLFIPNLKLFQPQTYLDVDDSFYTSDEFTKWNISKTSFEFVPKGVETTVQEDLNITQLNISRDQVATTPFVVTDGFGQVDVVENHPHKKVLQISTQEPLAIQFNTFNFPGWTLVINDNQVEINDNNPLKLITTTIEPGDYTVDLEFKDTPVRRLANTTSLISLFILTIFSYLLVKRNTHG